MRIIATAPSRISLIGGGTDVNPFRLDYGGKVLSMAINLRTHVKLLTDDDLFQVTDHKIPSGATRDLLYAIRKEYGYQSFKDNFVISSFDGFIGAGLGSSASFTVALISAISKYKKLYLTREQIAQKAFDIEVNKLGWWGGCQDQYASSIGGLNFFNFGQRVAHQAFPRYLAEEFLDWCVLIYIGGQRQSSKIQNNFKTLTRKKLKSLEKLKDMVLEGERYLWDTEFYRFGLLMNRAWEFKKQSNPKVSNDKIDSLYKFAKENGALGGKILGAGGAGYIFFIVPPKNRTDFINQMVTKGIEQIDFGIDWNGVEARIL